MLEKNLNNEAKQPFQSAIRRFDRPSYYLHALFIFNKFFFHNPRFQAFQPKLRRPRAFLQLRDFYDGGFHSFLD